MRGRKRMSRGVRGGASSEEVHMGERRIAGRGLMSRMGSWRMEGSRRMEGASGGVIEDGEEVREVVVGEEEGVEAEVLKAIRSRKQFHEKRISQHYHLQRPHRSYHPPIRIQNRSCHLRGRSRAGLTKWSKADRSEAEKSADQSVQR